MERWVVGLALTINAKLNVPFNLIVKKATKIIEQM